ncbi:Vacuolar protein sorting-associated protein 54, N-terminal [Trema orientale]|uniref:Vacuolar protein sorting-associated protein 54, N-terminal n=1 Tax=Trema orientale TaxID=63057 RepID=A0A2P5DD37_TREOI|nr:Vacuolar protein sorting-associated protein 54, N-terminal [Trema orientale]
MGGLIDFRRIDPRARISASSNRIVRLLKWALQGLISALPVEMQPNLFPFGTVLGNPFLFNGDLSEGFESSRVFFLVPFLLAQGGGMDLSKVGEKILSSVRSARSLGLLPSASDHPEVPQRAAAAAAVARALAGLPPHQRFSLSSSSEELSSIYGSRPHSQVVAELEEDFYEEEFDPIRHILENIPPEENELEYFEKQATLRLAQLDKVAERLSRQVMEHHEVMVKGMNLVREVEKDLKVANVICMNGRRHLNSSVNEVSRDLIVNSHSKKKQALLDIVPVLTELRHALDMQAALESLAEEGNYWKAFQVLSEYLQLLDSFSELSAVQEMSRGVESWLGRTLQKLDSLLLGVCQEFKEEGYITVVDAYALIGDISGLAEKIQSFFMQEVLSETHSVVKNTVQEDTASQTSNIVLKESDTSMKSGEIQKIESASVNSPRFNGSLAESVDRAPGSSSTMEAKTVNSLPEDSGTSTPIQISPNDMVYDARKDDGAASTSGSPWYQLRKDATGFVSQTLQRGRKNLWQLTTSRISVLLSCSAVCSASIHQFLKNYEDLNVFILAGEAFCGVEAVEFRQKLKVVCDNYFIAFHRQNIYALKMVLERENWLIMPPDTLQVISFAGLLGDGAPLLVTSDGNSTRARVHFDQSVKSVDTGAKKSGFSNWLKNGNPFLIKLMHTSKEGHYSNQPNGAVSSELDGHFNDNLYDEKISPRKSDANQLNGTSSVLEEENEDLLADFIDEDSQLPSRISKPKVRRSHSSSLNDDECAAQIGSSICLLRSMDKYARLMQKLEMVNVEFFKGICQLFELFFHFVFETFGQQSNNSGGKGSIDFTNNRLKTALSRIIQDCDQWIKPSSSTQTSLTASFTHADITPSPPSSNFGHAPGISFGLKERCAGADTISLVARMLHRSKAHLQSMLLQSNAVVEDFYVNLVDAVPDLIEHIHKTTARLLLHINGYVDRISNAKWEVKELGLEHNGYVDLLLGEFKHYKTRLTHGGIRKELQDLLSEYGIEIVAETLVEGLSRVKRCTDEGRALMSLDLQVLINGLQHIVNVNVKPKLQMVETFIKAYYLPETEYVHWSRAHPEYTKNQIVGLINLVASMKGWKRKTRLEILEKIE